MLYSSQPIRLQIFFRVSDKEIYEHSHLAIINLVRTQKPLKTNIFL